MQSLAAQFVDRAAGLVDMNERALQLRTGNIRGEDDDDRRGGGGRGYDDGGYGGGGRRFAPKPTFSPRSFSVFVTPSVLLSRKCSQKVWFRQCL